ncbi:MAG: hypothetical protein IKC09_06100 [Oscillospiraceae bacterium]|nr:hypothetical protein [Oscillospiraceae bacterium]
MKKDVRLYNLATAIYAIVAMLWYSWDQWLILIPVQFVVNSLVLYLFARQLGLENRQIFWLKWILPTWGISFLATLIAVSMVVLLLSCLSVLFFTWFDYLDYAPNVVSTLATILGVIIAIVITGLLIYNINIKKNFGKAELEPAAVHKLCLHLAIWTAPTVLIPLIG